MEKKERIVRVSAETARAMVTRGESRSDWAAAEAMSQAEVERLAEEEDGPLPAGWETTVEVGLPRAKEAVHIRLDADVLAWFRAIGPGYQTRINAVLQSFVKEKRRAEKRLDFTAPRGHGATGFHEDAPPWDGAAKTQR
jgi:uncharacterized protein (DUF4415 family)